MPNKNNKNNKKQLNYWLNNFKYVERNNKFDNLLGKKVWHNLLKNKKIYNVLECGSNIGRNLKQINLAYPNKKLSFIELNTEAFQICKLNKNIENSHNSSIENCKIPRNSYDLVFTSGVLIHLNDQTFRKVIKKMIKWTKKYIIILEYFSTTRIEKEYRGKKGLLFLREYGEEFLKTKKLNLLECGFLYSKIYKKAGFDDVTYWIFKKK
tara:strand:+ start:1700 stop:2326 length:627 start_codon:yes stop_codon:yes gene_type:complete